MLLRLIDYYSHKLYIFMKVKVELIARQNDKVYLLHPQTEEGAFPDFPIANITLFEPVCPFCGEQLVKAECSCKRFQEAKKCFLNSFEKENLQVRVKDLYLSGELVKDSDIVMKPVSAPDGALIIFDEGTEAELKDVKKTEKWYVSVGHLHGHELSFYMRRRGTTQYYRCEIKTSSVNMEKQLREAEVIEIGYSYRRVISRSHGHYGRLDNCRAMDDYQAEQVMSYSKYLQHLTEL